MKGEASSGHHRHVVSGFSRTVGSTRPLPTTVRLKADPTYDVHGHFSNPLIHMVIRDRRSYGRLMCMPPVTRSGRPSPVRSPTPSVTRWVGVFAASCSAEPHAAVVLEPHQALRRGIVPVVVGAHHGDVEIAIAVEVRRLRTRRAGKIRDAVHVEASAVRVFSSHCTPCQGRPLGGGVVERVPVAVEKIDVAVPVEIGGGRASSIRSRRWWIPRSAAARTGRARR